MDLKRAWENGWMRKEERRLNAVSGSGALHRAGEIRGDQERNGVKGAAKFVPMGLGGW